MEMQSAEVGELAKALCKAQAELEGAKKESVNPFYKNKYANLESVWDAVRGPFTKNGLSISQPTWHLDSAGVCVVTTLFHTSGQWVRGILPVMPLKNEPQPLGAAISYSRRFALAAMCGVIQVDDDGEMAHGRNYPAPKPQALAPQNPEPQKPRAVPSPARAGETSDLITFGKKYAGKRFHELTHDEIRNYVDYLRSSPDPLSANAKQFIDQANAYLEKHQGQSAFLNEANWPEHEPDVS